MNNRVFIAAIFVALTLGIAFNRAYAQSPMERATKEVADQEAGSTGKQDSSSTAVSAIPASPSDAVLGDGVTKQRYLEAMQRYYEYRANGYAYRSRVFEWQLLSSRVIFVVVLVLVGAGIYFAAVQ